MSGTFNVSRRIWDHPEFAPAPFSEREAFLWLVSEASWKPRTVRAGRVVVDLERGQLCASVRFMADAWDWSKSRVDRFLKRLENRDMLRSESGTGQLVITLCNYDEYQGPRDTSGTRVGQSSGHERDSGGTNEKKDEIRDKKVSNRDTNVSLALSAPEPANPIAEAVAAYNEAAAQSGWPKVQKLTPARSQAIRARLKECGGIEGWRVAMEKAGASDFLVGRATGSTPATFDWLTKQANFTKLMEGNYDNRNSARGGDTISDATDRQIAFAARARRTPTEDCF